MFVVVGGALVVGLSRLARQSDTTIRRQHPIRLKLISLQLTLSVCCLKAAGFNLMKMKFEAAARCAAQCRLAAYLQYLSIAATIDSTCFYHLSTKG